MTLYSVFNSGQLPHLAHGYRSFIAMEGRKWVTVVDWTTLESCKVTKDVWHRSKPEPVDYRASRILRAMRARLKYVTKTATIKAAMEAVANVGAVA